MKTQVHHKIPKCEGGTNDPENLIDLTLLDHGYEHAKMFLEGGIQFDFRNPFWEVLQVEDPVLAEAVMAEHKKRVSELGKRQGRKNAESGHMLRVQSLSDHSAAGKKGAAVTVEKKVGLHNPKYLGVGGKIGGKIGSANTNSQKWKCMITGFVSKPGPLTRYQKKRGIDPSNRIRIS
jgi:hypothetical protein